MSTESHSTQDDGLHLERMQCELCGRHWWYPVKSRDDVPRFCKECKAVYHAKQGGESS